MGRPPRVSQGGLVYHVLNRANAGIAVFEKPADYQAFENVLAEAKARVDMRILAYCIMPNHWHLILRPRKDGDLSRFVGWLTLTHTHRWHAHRENVGTGHVYQGRFKSFLVESDEHLFTVCRYVERNPLRADLVRRAEEWRWSSLWRRTHTAPADETVLSPWPTGLPDDWAGFVNEPLTPAELEALRECAGRGRPYGGEDWVLRATERFGLASTLHGRGRPHKRF